MNKIIKKEISQYFKYIKKNLPYFNKSMRKMFNDLKLSVNNYTEQNIITDFTEIENHFGKAENIAKEFATDIDSKYIKSYKIKKRLTLVFTISTIIIAVAITIFAAVIISNSNKYKNVYCDDVKITYEYSKEYNK